MTVPRWNPPPNWPAPPPGWAPAADWQPPYNWPPVPPGWPLWIIEQVPAVRPPTKAYRAVIIGAGLVALSTVLPWVNFAFVGSTSFFDLFRLDGMGTGVPWALVLLPLGTGGLAFTKSMSAYVVAIVVGVLGSLVGGLFTAGLIDAVSDLDGLASVQFGPFVGVAGMLTMIVGGIVGVARIG